MMSSIKINFLKIVTVFLILQIPISLSFGKLSIKDKMQKNTSINQIIKEGIDNYKEKIKEENQDVRSPFIMYLEDEDESDESKELENFPEVILKINKDGLVLNNKKIKLKEITLFDLMKGAWSYDKKNGPYSIKIEDQEIRQVSKSSISLSNSFGKSTKRKSSSSICHVRHLKRYESLQSIFSQNSCQSSTSSSSLFNHLNLDFLSQVFSKKEYKVSLHDSITWDDGLMKEILIHASDPKDPKGFNNEWKSSSILNTRDKELEENPPLNGKQHLIDIISLGESFANQIFNGEKPLKGIIDGKVVIDPYEIELNKSEIIPLNEMKRRKKDFDDTLFVSLMWYMQAKAGQSDSMVNPETFKRERGFVKGGTYRFQDGVNQSNLLFEFLRKRIGINPRSSSHYLNLQKEYTSQYGYDYNPRKSLKLPKLPGKKGTKTILFGALKDGTSFFKCEREPLHFLKKPVASTKHIINWGVHIVIEKLGLRRNEMNMHRETLHRIFDDMIFEVFKERKENQSLSNIISDLNQLENDLKTLKSNEPELRKVLVLKNNLIQYAKFSCNYEGTFDDSEDIIDNRIESDIEKKKMQEISREGCEAIISIDPSSHDSYCEMAGV